MDVVATGAISVLGTVHLRRCAGFALITVHEHSVTRVGVADVHPSPTAAGAKWDGIVTAINQPPSTVRPGHSREPLVCKPHEPTAFSDELPRAEGGHEPQTTANTSRVAIVVQWDGVTR
jgi:hypothetical protein